MEANVKDIEVFEDTVKTMRTLLQETDGVCQEQITLCQRVLNECTIEHAFTRALLVKAQAREAAAIADLARKEARLASLLAREAAALARENWVAAANIAQQIPKATDDVKKAAEELKQATKHRKDMEKRMELAEKAVKIAEEMDDRTQRLVHHHYSSLEQVNEQVAGRLGFASQDTHQYDEQKNVQVSEDVLNWSKWTPPSHDLSPEMLGEHFNQMPSQMIGVTLQNLYERDPKFRERVNTLRVTTEKSTSTLELQTELTFNLMEALVVEGVSTIADDVQVRACWLNKEKEIQVKLALQHPKFAHKEGDFLDNGGKLQLDVFASHGENVNNIHFQAEKKPIVPYSSGQLEKFCLEFVYGKQDQQEANTPHEDE